MRVRDSGMPPEDYWNTFFNVESIFKELLFDKDIKDAAEFGSGYGTFTIPASKIIRGNLVAFDIDDAMIASLNNKISDDQIKNIITVKADFVKDGTGLKNNSVDYVMLFNILHAEEPVKFLKEAFRILKPNGKAGIIHWIHSDKTPRGPSLDIRPKEEDCIKWLIEAGFDILIKPVALPPFHYGLTGIKR